MSQLLDQCYLNVQLFTVDVLKKLKVLVLLLLHWSVVVKQADLTYGIKGSIHGFNQALVLHTQLHSNFIERHL